MKYKRTSKNIYVDYMRYMAQDNLYHLFLGQNATKNEKQKSVYILNSLIEQRKHSIS